MFPEVVKSWFLALTATHWTSLGTTGYSRVQAELRDTFNIWYWTILYFFLNSKSSGKLGFME